MVEGLITSAEEIEEIEAAQPARGSKVGYLSRTDVERPARDL